MFKTSRARSEFLQRHHSKQRQSSQFNDNKSPEDEGRREEHATEGVRVRDAGENIFTYKDEVTEGWSKLYNEEFYNLYPSRNISSMIYERCGRTVRDAWGHDQMCESLVGKPEGKKARKERKTQAYTRG
jgi:hypothetical protein